jgi:hypothetical protein
MCFQGRNNSLMACDSGTGAGVASTACETEPVVMESCKNRSRKRPVLIFYKSHFGRNEGSTKPVHFGVGPQCKQSALQEPEFLNIMLSARRLISPGAFWLMFLYSSLNSPNDPVAGVALAAFRHGSHRLRKRAIWPAKQQPFFSTFAIQEAEISI